MNVWWVRLTTQDCFQMCDCRKWLQSGHNLGQNWRKCVRKVSKTLAIAPSLGYERGGGVLNMSAFGYGYRQQKDKRAALWAPFNS